ncbi:MAG TPA: glucosamine-6-phosphate deaminase [Lacisediminihabitans sp.]|uniref:glucosamine-6-phosphate deaminase n=1 Tax=Lacisediminihabitans sp. TaxID=2787631 RepID=UPI002ED7728D
MEIVIMPSAEHVGRFAAERVVRLVARRPQAVLGLATGSSPSAAYSELARRRAKGIDFSRVRGFALDEYVGIPREAPQSYFSVVRTEIVEPLGMDPSLIRVPDGLAVDLEAACAEYDAAIAAAGGIDLQILGIGGNGHIGFNEPTSSLSSRTRPKALAPRTRRDNARFFAAEADVPEYCVTQGLGTILEAAELLLVAQGEDKAEAIARAVEGPLSSFVPASVLQLHPRALVIIDETAASGLRNSDYYRHALGSEADRWV